jgi:hypothetical protein
MPGLAATGKLSYNGVQFTGAHNIRAVNEVVYDETHRRAVAHRITITCETVITNDSNSTDITLESMRFALGQSGRILIFKNKGFGDDLTVNKGTLRDIDNGPHPEILSWEPIGNDLACHVVWRVVVTIPPCKYSKKLGIKTVVWGASWRIDQEGDTTRTLSGHIDIVGVRRQTTADAFRDWFAPAPVHGFSREQEWSLDPAKNRIDFAIVDQQIPSPNPYPQFIPRIQATHRVSWNRSRSRSLCLTSLRQPCRRRQVCRHRYAGRSSRPWRRSVLTWPVVGVAALFCSRSK